MSEGQVHPLNQDVVEAVACLRSLAVVHEVRLGRVQAYDGPKRGLVLNAAPTSTGLVYFAEGQLQPLIAIPLNSMLKTEHIREHLQLACDQLNRLLRGGADVANAPTRATVTRLPVERLSQRQPRLTLAASVSVGAVTNAQSISAAEASTPQLAATSGDSSPVLEGVPVRTASKAAGTDTSERILDFLKSQGQPTDKGITVVRAASLVKEKFGPSALYHFHRLVEDGHLKEVGQNGNTKTFLIAEAGGRSRNGQPRRPARQAKVDPTPVSVASDAGREAEHLRAVLAGQQLVAGLDEDTRRAIAAFVEGLLYFERAGLKVVRQDDTWHVML